VIATVIAVPLHKTAFSNHIFPSRSKPRSPTSQVNRRLLYTLRHLVHASIPVSLEHRRAKSDRPDIGLLKRAFLGWLRGEAKHCSMAAIPTLEGEDTKRPNASTNIWSARVPPSPTG
jgi:hypothetical protein